MKREDKSKENALPSGRFCFSKRKELHMVTFTLAEETEQFLVYWYFPEGDKENRHGVITLDKRNETITLTKLAPSDSIREHSVEAQNALRDSANAMLVAEGKPELSEEDWPAAKEPIRISAYASHAMKRITDAYNAGEILHEGMAMWY
jgi:hypothetical protein